MTTEHCTGAELRHLPGGRSREYALVLSSGIRTVVRARRRPVSGKRNPSSDASLPEVEAAIRYCSIVSKLVFVRHSKPLIDPALLRADWSLSPEGRSLSIGLGDRLDLGAGVDVVASTERKAIETAELLTAGSVRTDERLGEVDKPWYAEAQSHAEAVLAYLSGGRLEDWEPQGHALERFSAVIDESASSDVVVVTHGTVLSLWLGRVLDDFDGPAFWAGLAMPDAYILDTAANRLAHVES